METRFIADAMLGRLSKWLRVMGYDTDYQMFYEEESIRRSIQEGRVFLSRRARISEVHPGVIWVHSDAVGEQLRELVARDVLRPSRTEWFRRCLVCNVLLRKAAGEISMESVPDYVLHHQMSDIRWCPACHRLFWAGTHRENMILQLEKWGF
jgi:uncharacterized protein with PIN domain